MKRVSKTARKKKEQHINRLQFEEWKHKDYVETKQKAINEEKLNEELDKKYDKNTESPIMSDDDLLNKFNEQLQKKEAIVELVDLKNIKMKANISQEQRDAIVILLSIYEKLSNEGYKIKAIWNICKEFIEMSPSIEGKRAEQYVEAHKSSISNNMLNNPMASGYGQYSDKMQQMRK